MSMKKHLTKLQQGQSLLEKGKQATGLVKQAAGLLSGTGTAGLTDKGGLMKPGGFAGPLGGGQSLAQQAAAGHSGAARAGQSHLKFIDND
ncbi:hypothetical protein [Xenorhabdus sp. Sc-CR9]|uniref:hypothetical protein n=1 Tax=Xenorhabdus sp. Sc-CR9 TaxID=2584468 RepID=UPI001F389705|nr:hypothetical protein [Xenorhabdus sp. Sc-CR9]